MLSNLAWPSRELWRSLLFNVFWLALHVTFADVDKLRPAFEPHGPGFHVSLAGLNVRCTWHSLVSPSSSSTERPQCQYMAFDQYSNGVIWPTEERGTIYSYPASVGGFIGSLYEVMLPDVVPTASHIIPGVPDPGSGTVMYRCRDNSSVDWNVPSKLSLYGADSRLFGDISIALVADMGVLLSEDTIKSLNNAFTNRTYGPMAMVVHVGDISYADDRFTAHNWRVWNNFLDLLQPMASSVLYMTAPGNHEAQFNFTAYHNWFRMPYQDAKSTSPDYYSFDYLGVHFSMISTEVKLFPRLWTARLAT